MAKMNALKKKAAVKKYSDAFKANQEEAHQQMITDGLSEEQAFEVSEALMAATETDETPKEESKKGKSTPAKNKEGKNIAYEKWAVEVGVERDADNDVVYDKHQRTIPKFTKEKLLRTVKISEAQAEILNSQSVNSKLRYYPAK